MDENGAKGDGGSGKASNPIDRRNAGRSDILRFIDDVRADLAEVERGLTTPPTLQSGLAMIAVSMRATTNMVGLNALVVAECYASWVSARLKDVVVPGLVVDADAAQWSDPEAVRRIVREALRPRRPDGGPSGSAKSD